MLKKAGYATYHVGKWHEGYYKSIYTPHGRGFDQSLGFLNGGEDHFNQVTLIIFFTRNPDNVPYEVLYSSACCFPTFLFNDPSAWHAPITSSLRTGATTL